VDEGGDPVLGAGDLLAGQVDVAGAAGAAAAALWLEAGADDQVDRVAGGAVAAAAGDRGAGLVDELAGCVVDLHPRAGGIGDLHALAVAVVEVAFQRAAAADRAQLGGAVGLVDDEVV
jgi:hypothetical protein